MPSAVSVARRRPKDRKEQILKAARQLIVEFGYSNVSMAQIAERVGITAGALYRHFSHKPILLGAVTRQSFAEVTPTPGARTSLADALAEGCELAVAHRDVGTLWWRESRHLPEDLFDELREHLRAVNRYYSDLIRTDRPALRAEDAEVLGWGVEAILAGSGSHSPRSGVQDLSGRLTAACKELCAVELLPYVASKPSPRLQPVSKREVLLKHAVTLFEKKGYEATGLDDIGAAAGVTGPNLYSYFEGKADIVQAAIERGTSALWLLLDQVLRSNDRPQDALHDLVHGYTQLTFDRAVPTALLYTDTAILPETAGARQREYVQEWVALLRASRQDLDETSAKVLVHAALDIVNTLSRIEHLRANGAFPANLAQMALAVLFAS